MGHIISFPYSLKQLDLSNNCISNWFDLNLSESEEESYNMCFSNESFKGTKLISNSHNSTGHRLMNNLCPHRRHLKLDNLRTLILANNNLEKICLTSEKDFSDSEDGHWVNKFFVFSNFNI